MTDADTGLSIAALEIQADPFNERGAFSYAHTDSDGRYTLRGVAPGTSRIRARWNEHGYIQEFYDDKHHWDDADLLTISGAEAVKGIDFGLRLGATISGRVTDAETGLPIAKVDIDADNIYGGGPNSNDNTDSDGQYTLRGVAPGT